MAKPKLYLPGNKWYTLYGDQMIENIKKYALDNDVPIIKDEGLSFILDKIKEYKVTSILEVGSAIGYSAIKFATADKDIKVTTIEVDTNRYNLALKNINDLNLNQKIEILNMDANDFKSDKKFDMIFLDGPKSQYDNMLNHLYTNLLPGGIIIVDNLVFYGLVFQEHPKVRRRTRQLVEKLKLFRQNILQDKRFTVYLYDDIGDGMGLLVKKRGA